MGCGCNKGNTSTVKTATAAAGVGALWEVLDTGGSIRLRTRDESVATARVNANAGWRKRRAGER